MNHPREILTFDNEADWLAAREPDVTSTEAAALFGCSPYSTEYMLYHRKTGQLEAEFEETDWIKWGRRMEPVIAAGIAEDFGLTVEPFKSYIRIPALRMGSSFDFKIVGIADDWSGTDSTYRDLFIEHGPGILEIKNVMGWAFRRGWIEDGDSIEAPPHIELQVQHQLEVAGDFGWTMIAPLIDGNTPKPTFRMRDYEIGAAIRAKVAEFWERVSAGNAPDPDFAEDAEAIGRLYLNSNGETVDMSDNNYLATLCAEYAAAGEDEKATKKRRDALKAEILTIVGEAGKVMAAGFTISAGTVAENPGKLITADMLGERIGARKGYRSVRITAKKAA